ncbi:Shedu anti-phage system protein SduA domain-containing protein [uncultured Ruminococcus sp.]|uniref:Shedu anti-phage system protein SduA domain-containing protein n=1 Tax=uncultured Ruminococcus sp. TaxID=165186 RepID=UPI00292E1553|nr:Shedu anti-phage system protein SduA domain-containing protein [uncultured Ruminococcus sp.]
MGSIKLGIYDRDYSSLFQDEIDEKERLDKEYHVERMFHPSPYTSYPSAVRHNMSLFPNNYLDPVELRDKQRISDICNEYKDLLCTNDLNEAKILRFIKEKQYYMIPASIFTLFSFGHHDAFLFREFPIGNDYRADYLLIGRSSDGYSFVLVEFEHPNSNITIEDGELGKAFRDGIKQIKEWQRYLEFGFSSITNDLKKYTNEQLPDEMYTFDSTRFHYVVVAGRRSDFTDKTYRIRREFLKDKDIALLHYDNLYDYAKTLMEHGNY